MTDFKVYVSERADYVTTPVIFTRNQETLTEDLRVLPGASYLLQPYDLLDSPVTSDGAQDTTFTLPTAAKLVNYLTTAYEAGSLDKTFDFYVYNFYMTNSITVVGNTGVTILDP